MSLASTLTMDDALTVIDYDEVETLPDDEEFDWEGPDSLSEMNDNTDSDLDSDSECSDISFSESECGKIELD